VNRLLLVHVDTLRQQYPVADIMAALGADNVATVPELEDALDAEANKMLDEGS
jgi:hypothetical protein